MCLNVCLTHVCLVVIQSRLSPSPLTSIPLMTGKEAASVSSAVTHLCERVCVNACV